MLPSVVTIGSVARHLNFNVPSSLDYALTAGGAKTGAFVASSSTGVALDDVETNLGRALLARPNLDRRYQLIGSACTPLIRVDPHRH